MRGPKFFVPTIKSSNAENLNFYLVDYVHIILKSCNGERKKVLHPRLRSFYKRSK